jgi:hypothetical protein
VTAAQTGLSQKVRATGAGKDSPDAFRGVNVRGGHAPEGGRAATFAGKSYCILSVRGVLYMWVCLLRPEENDSWNTLRGRLVLVNS